MKSLRIKLQELYPSLLWHSSDYGFPYLWFDWQLLDFSDTLKFGIVITDLDWIIECRTYIRLILTVPCKTIKKWLRTIAGSISLKYSKAGSIVCLTERNYKRLSYSLHSARCNAMILRLSAFQSLVFSQSEYTA